MKAITLLLVSLILTSCATFYRYKGPYQVVNDTVMGVKFTSSNKMAYSNYFSWARPLRFEVYLVEDGKLRYPRMRYEAKGRQALHANQMAFRCGKNKPIIFEDKAQQWRKQFDVDCSAHICNTIEKGDFIVDESKIRKILTCKEDLFFKVSGRGFEVVPGNITTINNKRFYEGMRDMAKLIKTQKRGKSGK